MWVAELARWVGQAVALGLLGRVWQEVLPMAALVVQASP
jgi:hypothetical protein